MWSVSSISLLSSALTTVALHNKSIYLNPVELIFLLFYLPEPQRKAFPVHSALPLRAIISSRGRKTENKLYVVTARNFASLLISSIQFI